MLGVGIVAEVIFERHWSMPSSETFTMQPVEKLLKRRVGSGLGWMDPFAGENSPAQWTNDLNPEKPTQHHLEADEFCKLVDSENLLVKGGLFDPPYSPRQIKEVYDGIGQKWDGLSSFYSKVKDKIEAVALPGCEVISFGWNSQGMGTGRGFKLLEIHLIAHGGAHNDTIVVVEKKVQGRLT